MFTNCKSNQIISNIHQLFLDILYSYNFIFSVFITILYKTKFAIFYKSYLFLQSSVDKKYLFVIMKMCVTLSRESEKVEKCL